MKDKAIITVHDLDKKYKIQHKLRRNANPTIRDEIVRIAKKPLALVGAYHGVEREDFWALKDINFDVYQGDVVGIMGRNGSGKSTLFKILSKVTSPTRGRIELNGKTASLLEVGTGFHPELTGRENVYFNGAVLGMSKKEIDRRFDEIVDFSEVEKFIDTPVKFYSSGMKVRLAFSVSAHLNPDILIIDEVLAVGDVRFKQKSLKRMRQVADSGTTILFVSHIVSQIKAICNRGILLDEGHKVYDGNLDEAVEEYLSLNAPQEEEAIALPRKEAFSTGDLELENIKTEVKLLDGLPALEIYFDVVNYSRKEFKNVRASFMITDAAGKNISLINNSIVDQKIDIGAGKERTTFKFSVKELNLIPDIYKLRATLSDNVDTTNIYFREIAGMAFNIPSYSFGEILMSNTNPQAASVIYKTQLERLSD